MAVTEFVAVNWNANQVIDEDSLDQINNNINYLKNNTLSGAYQLPGGAVYSKNLKFIAGKTNVGTAGQTDIYSSIYFSKMFTPNSSPIVVATAYVGAYVTPVMITGLDGGAVLDHRGFQAHIQSITYGPFVVQPQVHWIAISF